MNTHFTETLADGKVHLRLTPEYMATLTVDERQALATFLWDDGFRIDAKDVPMYVRMMQKRLVEWKDPANDHARLMRGKYGYGR